MLTTCTQMPLRSSGRSPPSAVSEAQFQKCISRSAVPAIAPLPPPPAPSSPGRRIPFKYCLVNPVAFEFRDDIGVHGLGVRDIQIALGNRAAALSGKTAPVKRGRQARVDPQCGIEISDSVLVHAGLEIEEP